MIDLHICKHGLAAASAAVVMALSCSAAAALPGEGVSVQPVQTPDPAAQFQTEIVIIGLERLGYDVQEMKFVQIPAAFLAVAQEDGDFYAQAWDPLHKSFYDRAGGAEKLTMTGVLVDGCAQGYQIDKRTSEEHGITHLEQLQDPDVARIFDSDGNGKADLIGCPPGWGCERNIDFQMDAYGLRDTVDVRSGEFTPIHTDAVSRYKAGESVLYYTYTPLWLNEMLVVGEDVVWLEVSEVKLPPEIMEQDPDTILEDGKNTGWDINRIRIVANNDFLAANPAAKRWFELVTVPLEDVNAQNLRVFEGEKSDEDVRGHAEEWVSSNQQQFDAWIEEALKAAE